MLWLARVPVQCLGRQAAQRYAARSHPQADQPRGPGTSGRLR